MKDFVEVYKRVDKEEFVIHTILHPSGKTATMRWYSRSRPFHGATHIDIIKEGTKKKISLIKGNFRSNDIWQMYRRHFVNEIDEYVKSINKEEKKEIKAEKLVDKKKNVSGAGAFDAFKAEASKKKIIVKDVKDEE